MARIFKATYGATEKRNGERVPVVRNGERVYRESRKWYVEYRDADGVAHRKCGYTDKGATVQLAAQLERAAARQASGLTDRFAVHRKRLLSEHVDDWHASLTAKGKIGRAHV